MKKINYSSQSLRHIISSAIVIVISSIITACFLIPAATMETILSVLLIFCVICVLYLIVHVAVDLTLTDLEKENDKDD